MCYSDWSFTTAVKKRQLDFCFFACPLLLVQCAITELHGGLFALLSGSAWLKLRDSLLNPSTSKGSNIITELCALLTISTTLIALLISRGCDLL